jgi:hypothetical protein
MTLYGKGLYIWQIARCEGGDATAIARKAVSAGLSHVLIKIADGSNWAYNYDFERRVDLVPSVLEALKASGIEVWGWHYVRGDDPVGEARLAVDRCRRLGVDGYVIDAEGEYKRPGRRPAALRFMQELRAGLPRLPVGLSTYRYPRSHPTLPYSEFLDRCDYAMPQVYFEFSHNPEEQLDRSVSQYLSLRPARPVIPTGPAYGRGAWKPTAAELTRFMVRAKDSGLTGFNAWSWEYATRPSYQDLWDAIAGFEWQAAAPVADIPEQLVGRWNQHDPALVAGLYVENAAHVTGARTVVGREAIHQWYQTYFHQLLPNSQFRVTGKMGSGQTRQFTWMARSDNGVVLDGNDTLGLRDGRIQYHYTYFTIN